MKRLGLVALALLASACSNGAGPGLIVGVASSMTDVIEDIAEGFPDARLVLSVAGSQVLVSQAREGAPLDVIITADEETARELALSGVVAHPPVAFAGNRLAIAVAAGNPLGIAGLADLARSDVIVVLAAPEVPAGRYTARLLEETGVSFAAASLEPSVRAALSKVELGEADAAIVYHTDIRDREGISGIDIEGGPATTYYAAALATSPHLQAAEAFIAFLQSPAARATLAEFGFTS